MNLPEANSTQLKPKTFKLPSMPWIWDILLIGVLLIGAYFRFVGVNWDDTYHLHPDERFLTMVENDIAPAESLSQYFDTSTSTLNPNNRGHSYYVYGTLPLFLVRYVGEWIGQTGYGEIHVVGRVLSGIFDLGTILFVYLIAKRLYKNSRLGLIAALFLALSVLPIQLSHYFTVDTFANFFTFVTIYLAVCIMSPPTNPAGEEQVPESPGGYWFKSNWQSFTLYALFAVAYGMAMACKVSIWSLALLLPLSAFIRYKKLSQSWQEFEVPILFRNLILAGVLAFITFRFFQPYAFIGPSFFGMKINPQWINGLKELATQSRGEVDVPFALQWARRPITFAFTNMVEWGLGIPLGIVAWAGFLWMGWRMIKGDWQKHILFWGWIAFVFISQSINWVRTMRYQLPIYPTLAIVAAWTIFKLWEDGANIAQKIARIQINWRRVLAVFIALVVILSTGAWAYAFTRIYTRPVTRVAASDWIYQNIPGAINIKLSTETGEVNQPIAYQNGAQISATSPYSYAFTPGNLGLLTQVRIEHVYNQQPQGATLSLIATVFEVIGDQRNVIGTGFTQSTFAANSDSSGDEAVVVFSTPLQLDQTKKYEIEFELAEVDGVVQLMGDVNLDYSNQGTTVSQSLVSPEFALKPGNPYSVTFVPSENGTIDGVSLNQAVDLMNNSEKKTLAVNLFDASDPSQSIAVGTLNDSFSQVKDPRGESKFIQFISPIKLDSTHGYILQFLVNPLEDQSSFTLAFYNNTLAIESSWDDALPLGMYGYNIWDYQSGIYGNVKNFEMYWPDSESKLERFTSILNQSDTLVISSNRQWGTTTRVEERYPLTIAYYRNLIGCPSNKDLLWCYQVAEPGMFKGNLGYELTAVFQSDPNLGSLKINDQSAEEAFTVYDHPKVLIFQKTDEYDAAKVQSILGAVDLSNIVTMTPGQASKFNGNLQLSEKDAAVQQAGGTWTEIFNPLTLVNQNQYVAAIAWYLVILLLGWMVYPFVRWALKSLPDHGYPFSRLVGLLLLALLTWLASSNGAQFNRVTITIVLCVLLIINGVLAYLQRKELAEELKHKKLYFLSVELIFLVFFLIDLGIRLGNPDLWHPYKGGEKPMDLSYFTAVVKSTTFPPYDPWYAGGYINYYYYGFVVVGVPVKFLGIVPAVAYNLILPTLFGLTALGAYSMGWNLLRGHSDELVTDERAANRRSLTGGLIASFSVLILGNLGTLRMFWQGLQRLVAPGGVIENAALLQRWSWFFSGLMQFFQGVKLPYGTGDWYWIPSRALPGDVITEFPFFTFTYADLHAHMIALPITILAVGWILSILLGRWQWGKQRKEQLLNFGMSFVLGSVVIGALRPTNTWDLPTYLVLAVLVILYSVIRYAEIPTWFLRSLPDWSRKCIYAIGAVALFVGLLFLFYLPFSKWFGQAYGSVDRWTGDHSPLASYLTHWGLFFFVIISWFVWETREWMAATPVSSLLKLKKYAIYLQLLAILFVLVLILFSILGIKIAWVAVPLALWALVLIFRPDQPDVKRLVLFMIGTALALTLFVELFALHGDIGRMNTVFKFYYQAWTLLALGSAVALMWLIPAIVNHWGAKTSAFWQIGLAFLVFGALLYPITAAQDKIDDRMSATAPHTLDGSAYMASSVYSDQNVVFDLSQDYDGIKWMQQNILGSPVIVEGNTVEYRWGNRYTINTGLPGVLGWNWHQRQQRGFLDIDSINNRSTEIPAFYNTTDVNQAVSFLKKYNVKYLVVGQLERAYYPGDGLLKFESYNGVYWKEVFREKETVIYEVLSQ